MIIRIGYVPYLNMVPFHQGFGPEPMEIGGRSFEFRPLSPRALGLEAEKGTIDAGALSLLDSLQLASHYEPLGQYGIGVNRAAGSVLLFSRIPLAYLKGVCAVTDETSTSFRLLQLLLEKRYQIKNVSFGRIASAMLFDGSADALLLIGDEAIRARLEGVKGFPIVTDLGEEWFSWQGHPFMFARWVARRGLRQDVKDMIEVALEKSLQTSALNNAALVADEAQKRRFAPELVSAYWSGFAYRLQAEHLQSAAIFQELSALHV